MILYYVCNTCIYKYERITKIIYTFNFILDQYAVNKK